MSQILEITGTTMPTSTKSPKKEPKATPITKKSNLASKEHEALLEWLIQELENVSDVMLGRNEEWFKESVEKAITAFHESNASLLKALEDASQNERWLPAYRSACAAKLKWARALFKRFNSPPLPEFESASSPKVRDWSAQAQIFTKAGYVAATGRHIEPKPAGFVDLQVLMGIPECLLVKCFDKEVVYRIDSNNWGMSEEG